MFCTDLDQWQWIQAWAGDNFLFKVDQADTKVRAQMVLRNQQDTMPPIYDRWMAQQREPELRRRRARGAISWQLVATRILHQPTLIHVHTHLRRRLDNLPSSILPGFRVQRVVRMIQRLNSLVAPRVVSAYLRTICDGWATHARFQRHAPCRFGCGHGRDCISHIACCPVALAWIDRHAQLRRPPIGRGIDFLLCMTDDCLDAGFLRRPGAGPEDVLRARALSLYALYKCHNGVRHRYHSITELAGAFKGYLREGRLASPLTV